MTSAEKQELLDLPNADVTLVSSDNVQFHVHKLVLSLASPFFQSLFSLPGQSSSSSPEAISLAESSAMLGPILRCLYSIAPKPKVRDIEEGALLIQTAQKLDLDAVVEDLTTQIELLLLKCDNPFVAWAQAIRCGVEGVRKSSIIQIIRLEDDSYDTMIRNAKDDLRHVTGRDLYSLMMRRKTAIFDARKAILMVALSNEYQARRGESRLPEDFRRAVGILNPLGLYGADMALLQFAHALPKNCDCSTCLAEPSSERRQAEFNNIRTIFQSQISQVTSKLIHHPVKDGFNYHILKLIFATVTSHQSHRNTHRSILFSLSVSLF